MDPKTSSGRLHIRQCPSQACVQPGWVDACLDAGRALLSEDDYGGWRALDDGIDSDGDEELTDEEAEAETKVHPTK